MIINRPFESWRALRSALVAVLTATLVAGCDQDATEIAREIDAAREGCTEEALEVASYRPRPRAPQSRAPDWTSHSQERLRRPWIGDEPAPDGYYPERPPIDDAHAEPPAAVDSGRRGQPYEQIPPYPH